MRSLRSAGAKMEVLMMTGMYAGQIRDIKPFNARQMIADGRALDPNAPIVEEVTVLVPKAEVPLVVAAKRKGSR